MAKQIYPGYDIETQTWFVDDGKYKAEAPTIRALLSALRKKYPKQRSFTARDYYPNGAPLTHWPETEPTKLQVRLKHFKKA